MLVITHRQRNLCPATCMRLDQSEDELGIPQWHTAMLTASRIHAMIERVDEIIDAVQSCGPPRRNLKVR